MEYTCFCAYPGTRHCCSRASAPMLALVLVHARVVMSAARLVARKAWSSDVRTAQSLEVALAHQTEGHLVSGSEEGTVPLLVQE